MLLSNSYRDVFFMGVVQQIRLVTPTYQCSIDSKFACVILRRFDNGQSWRRDNSAGIVRSSDGGFRIFRPGILAYINRHRDSAFYDYGDGYLLFHDYGCRNFNACFNFNRYGYFDDTINLDGLRDADETVYFYGHRLIDNLEHLLFDFDGLHQGPTHVDVAGKFDQSGHESRDDSAHKHNERNRPKNGTFEYPAGERLVSILHLVIGVRGNEIR